MNDVQIYQIEFPERVCQGHIYNNISYFERLSENEANYVEFREEHAVVISQDCDLYQDHNLRENPPNSDAAPHDKFLLNILFCPLYLFDSFAKGEHLLELERKMQRINTQERHRIRTNQNFRYHFFEKQTDFQVPELVADFKHFFTIDREFFYKAFHNKDFFLCSINPLFREDLSQRFSSFLARIPLPKRPQD